MLSVMLQSIVKQQVLQVPQSADFSTEADIQSYPKENINKKPLYLKATVW